MAAASIQIEIRLVKWAVWLARLCGSLRNAGVPIDMEAVADRVVDWGAYVRLRPAGPWRRLGTLAPRHRNQRRGG